MPGLKPLHRPLVRDRDKWKEFDREPGKPLRSQRCLS